MKKIKNTGLLSVLFLSLALLAGCSKSNQSTPDPAGTNTENLLVSTGIQIDTAHAIYSSNGQYVSFYQNIVSLTLDANLNLGISYAAGVNAPYGLSWIVGCSTTIANLGSVSSLGSIGSFPASGYAGSTLAQNGYGYVIKLTDNDPTSTLTHQIPRTRYYRVYISSTVIGTGNTIAGYTVKYQGPF